MTPKPTTAPRMLAAHIVGIVVGSALGVIVQALVKKHALPPLGLEESPIEALGRIIKDLPKPDADSPPRPSRTGSAVPEDTRAPGR